VVKQGAVCANVIDGDTFDTGSGIRIRLARVYAPEIETAEGQKAKRLLEVLILNKAIRYEVVAKDDYGRSVAEVWVGGTLGGTNVNDAMRSYGYEKPQ
jgi:endonuclease YncB( thermonuclease family)